MYQSDIILGITNPKSPTNMGSILRAAGCFGASAVYYTGQRYEFARKYATDTHDKNSQIPQIHCQDLTAVDLNEHVRIGVELVEGAIPLPHFEHPDKGFYLFGPEDGSLSQHQLDHCDYVVYLPTNGCLNLAATVNILLYDRIAKSPNTVYGDEVIRHSRDTNNNTRVKTRI